MNTLLGVAGIILFVLPMCVLYLIAIYGFIRAGLDPASRPIKPNKQTRK